MESLSTSRRRGRIILPVVAICTALAGGALFFCYVESTAGDCKTDVRRSIPSPDGEKSLVVFTRECGASVGFNTQISVAPARGSFSFENYPAFFATSGVHDVTAIWLGGNTVEIALIPGGGQLFRSEQSVGDIKVVYK